MSLVSAYALQSVTHTPRGTIQADGTYDYTGTAATIKARVVDERKDRYTPDGLTRVYDRIFWIPASYSVSMRDKLTWGGIVHIITDLRVVRTLAGRIDHRKAMCNIV